MCHPPVGGAHAEALWVIAAGPRAALDEIRPWLQRIGKDVSEVGERPCQAQLMNLVNNLISAANMATAFEALVLGAKGGLDPDLMVNVINVSSGPIARHWTRCQMRCCPARWTSARRRGSARLTLCR